MGVLYLLNADCDWVDQRIGYRDAFTDTVPRESRSFRHWTCACSHRYGESISHICLIWRGEMVATLKRRVRFTDIVALDDPIEFDTIKAELRHLYRNVEARRSYGGTIPPRTGMPYSKRSSGCAQPVRLDQSYPATCSRTETGHSRPQGRDPRAGERRAGSSANGSGDRPQRSPHLARTAAACLVLARPAPYGHQLKIGSSTTTQASLATGTW